MVRSVWQTGGLWRLVPQSSVILKLWMQTQVFVYPVFRCAGLVGIAYLDSPNSRRLRIKEAAFLFVLTLRTEVWRSVWILIVL